MKGYTAVLKGLYRPLPVPYWRFDTSKLHRPRARPCPQVNRELESEEEYEEEDRAEIVIPPKTKGKSTPHRQSHSKAQKQGLPPCKPDVTHTTEGEESNDGELQTFEKFKTFEEFQEGYESYRVRLYLLIRYICSALIWP
jgi:hypothetical protein